MLIIINIMMYWFDTRLLKGVILVEIWCFYIFHLAMCLLVRKSPFSTKIGSFEVSSVNGSVIT